MNDLIIFDINKNIINDTITLSHYEEIFDYHIFGLKRFNIGIFDIIDSESLESYLSDESKFVQIKKTKIYSVYDSNNEFYESGTPVIKKVGLNRNESDIDMLSNNFSYTIHFNVKSIVSKDYIVILLVTDTVDTTKQRKIVINFKSTETEKKSIYDDLLVNYDLPDYNKLEKAIVNEDKAHLIKRLLLDYKNIMVSKGTDESIRKFLYFIGFDHDTVKVYPEYVTDDGKKTIVPNKDVDVKTGYYWVMYDNYRHFDNINEGLTNKNLPYRPLNNTNIDEFFERLFYGITLANRYFTIPEQDISFFGLINSANWGKFISTAGNTSIVHKDNIHYFKDYIDIDLFVQERLDETTYIVRDNRQKLNKIFKTEVKCIINSNSLVKKNLFLIDREIADDEIPSGIQPFTYIKTFGNILNFQIKNNNPSFKIYVDYKIYDEYDLTTAIESNRFILNPNEIHKIKYLTKKSSDYIIKVDIRDDWNNRELYTYKYLLDDSIDRLDFEIFNTTTVFDDIQNYNINSDVDSPSFTSSPLNISRVLDLFDVERLADLREYFEIERQRNTRNLNKNERYLLDSISKNTIIENCTETLPIKYLDTHIQLGSIPADDNKVLLLLDNTSLNHKFYELPNDKINIENDYYPSNLFLQISDIIENSNNPSVTKKYIFVTTTEVGIDLSLFKLFYVERSFYQELKDNSFDDSFDGSFTVVGGVNFNDSRFKQIYELPDYIQTDIPINFDVDTVFYDNNHQYNLKLPKDNKKVNSLYPRMIKITESIGNTYYLKIGDVICARINNNYITDYINLKWSVINAFDKKVLFETNDYMLKYRINRKTIYDIKCEFDIYGKHYTILKKAIQSSLKYE